MAVTKAFPAITESNDTACSYVPLWARDAIAAAIQQLDTPPWREVMSDHLPTFCQTVPRIQDLFVQGDAQARERVIREVFKGASRFHAALRFLNMPVPCNYTLLSGSDAIAVRTGYILCFVFRLIELIYQYGNDLPPPNERLDIAYMGKKFEESIFGGAVTLIFMQSELHIATEYISEITEKPSYASFTNEIIAALNYPGNPQAGVEHVNSEFICGYLGRHQLRPIDAIVSDQFHRNIEAQVAWEILHEGYISRKRRGFMRNIVMRVFQ
ncbi:hypothetical protein F4859DRAFT_514683 [Xylaria cf. heliscus]|nr:hypothetical protein F4859DRAFT_514683 [Xylaria cf. heliscus]